MITTFTFNSYAWQYYIWIGCQSFRFKVNDIIKNTFLIYLSKNLGQMLKRRLFLKKDLAIQLFIRQQNAYMLCICLSEKFQTFFVCLKKLFQLTIFIKQTLLLIFILIRTSFQFIIQQEIYMLNGQVNSRIKNFSVIFWLIIQYKFFLLKEKYFNIFNKMQQVKKTQDEQNNAQESNQDRIKQNESNREKLSMRVDNQNSEENVLIQTNQQQPIEGNKNAKKKEFSLVKYFRPPPDPVLTWDQHQEKKLYSEFQDFIESKYQEVKRSSSLQKYYFKIGFQVFIYILNVLELIFTLCYKSFNEMEDKEGIYIDCYLLSIIVCVLLHCGTWMYTFKFRQVAKKNICIQIGYYIFYMIMGGLSYFKLAPFLYYFNRDQTIQQFSFSEINKYLMLDAENKFRNPSGLFKKRTKPVNIFRDLIFHRVALVSMMITMCLQTFPQLFIQGFYNNVKAGWNGYNTFSYLLLISNLIYYLFELQFIVFTTTYRQMQTELQFKLKKIKLKFIQETKQLLKADLKYIGFVKSFYFQIDPSTFNSYQKKRCMVQIIAFLTKYKKLKNISFSFIDQYEEVTLQYLANLFKVIQVENISLYYKDLSKLQTLESIFNKSDFPQLKLELQNSENIDELWNSPENDENEEEEKVQKIQFIQNPKINAGWQVLQMNQQLRNREYIAISSDFSMYIPVDIMRSMSRNIATSYIKTQSLNNNVNTTNQDTSEKIAREAKEKIDSISKKDLFEERFGQIKFLMTLYSYYELWSQLNSVRGCLQTIWSLFNGSFQIISLVYLSQENNAFVDALIILTVLNPIMQMASFSVFQHRQFKDFKILNQVINTILFGICNFLKIWDIVMIMLYLCAKQFAQSFKRDFSSDGYLKFKSYAAKFVGNLPITVFKWKSVQLNGSIFEIMSQPFYQAVKWRTSVEEALNKLPQFFIYILALSEGNVSATWVLSFMQQLKEGVLAIKDILEVVVKDFFIPALILSKISVIQFFQSMLYLSSVSNQILLEYPKSFQIMSKVDEQYLKELYTFKIDVKNLDFSRYGGKKKEKMLAQFKYVLASMKRILEIEQAQRLFCMGPEIHDFVRCLKVSEIYQLKLNFYLDEVKAGSFPHINAFIKHCPQELQFLQISVETTDSINMEFCLERQATLTAFSYSYFQIMYKYENNAQTAVQQQCLNINKSFLELDRYDIEQFYFEVAGNLNLNESEKLFENFTNLKVFWMSLNNNNESKQTFNFQNNLKSRLEILDITFENINLDFQQYPFQDLKIFKLVMKRCQFNKQDLIKILENFKSQTQVIYIDMINCENRFTIDEQKELLIKLETKKIDVTIKI
ncbi:unnamed protein product [Paramecium sonneborni]|uniref:Transmembrane protein n=1 Tax=Paramecium sonneborni TaxID=65129 RepID=A0A8S1RD44_9CILI|nr:unnamed protein product [Paramecium sonneborni]